MKVGGFNMRGLEANVRGHAVFACFVVASFLGTRSLSVDSSVPLFEYARTRWEPERYVVSVVHRGRFSQKETVALNLLKKAERGGVLGLEILEPQARNPRIGPPAPEKLNTSLIVLRGGLKSGLSNPILKSSLSKRSVEMILKSPARREIVRRLASGGSAVFLFLDGPDERENRGLCEFLAERLRKSRDDLIGESDYGEPLEEEGAKKFEFSILRLKPSDERCLTAIVLASIPELSSVSRPIVVPVFGRGRALPAFYGKGINRFNILDAVETLTSAKREFSKVAVQGFDILISADWNEAYGLLREQRADADVSFSPPLVSVAVALKAHSEFESRRRQSEASGAKRESVKTRRSVYERHSNGDVRMLATTLVLVVSVLLICFAAVCARRIQGKTDS